MEGKSFQSYTIEMVNQAGLTPKGLGYSEMRMFKTN